MPIYFEWYALGLWYFQLVFVVTSLFMCTNWLDLVTLTLMFNLLTENFNLGYTF
jgi:hypothetical protein